VPPEFVHGRRGFPSGSLWEQGIPKLGRWLHIYITMGFVKSSPTITKSSAATERPRILVKLPKRKVPRKSKKIKFQGLRRVQDVPSCSRFVPKGTAPKGPHNTNPTHPNRVVVEISVFKRGLDLVKAGLYLTMPMMICPYDTPPCRSKMA
jgi:hypothetical protein